MRDYAEQIDSIRRCAESDDPVYECCFEDCNQHHGRRDNMCRQKIMMDAADAIEELLAAVHSVVHCKDCKWCHAGYCEKYDDLIPWGCANKPWEDWFCADGARMGGVQDALS